LDVALRGSTADLDDKLGKTEKNVRGFAYTVEDVGKRLDVALMAMTGGFSKVVGLGSYFSDKLSAAWEKFKGMATEGADGIAALAKSADRLGITTQMMGGLEHAAALVGLSFDDLGGLLNKFQRTVATAADGGGHVVNALQQIGVSIDFIKDKNLYEQMLLISDGIKTFGNEADKTRILAQLFGKSGIQIKAMMKLGAEGLREMTEEAVRMGIAVGTDQANAVRAGRRAAREYDEAIKGIGRSMAVVLAPLLESINSHWARLAKTVAEFATENIPLFQEFTRVVVLVKDAVIGAAVEMAGRLGCALMGAFEGAAGSGAMERFRDGALKVFYAVEFAATHWKDVLSLALDATNLSFLVLKRTVGVAMTEMAHTVLYTMNEWVHRFGFAETSIYKLGEAIGALVVFSAKMTQKVIGIDVLGAIEQFKALAENTDLPGLLGMHKQTPLEKFLKEEAKRLGKVTGEEGDLKERIKKKWGDLNENMAQFIDDKMEEFGLVFGKANGDVLDDMRVRFGGKNRAGIKMDEAPEGGKAMGGDFGKTGALERGSKEAFSVIYGTQTAQEKALAVANRQLSENVKLVKLMDKLVRQMRDPVVLKRARL
jgi:hypothetical protein